MGRLVNWIYGGVIIYLSLDALWLHIIPNTFLSILVALMGALILFTPIDNPHGALNINNPRPRFQFIRRWVFGIFFVLIGLLSIEIFYNLLPYPFGAFLFNITLNSSSGPLLMLVIGVIYFLASFARTRRMQISTI